MDQSVTCLCALKENVSVNHCTHVKHKSWEWGTCLDSQCVGSVDTGRSLGLAESQVRERPCLREKSGQTLRKHTLACPLASTYLHAHPPTCMHLPLCTYKIKILSILKFRNEKVGPFKFPYHEKFH